MPEQLDLGTGVVAPLPRRPEITDEAVVEAALLDLANALCEMFDDGTAPDDVIDDLRFCVDDDGYRFARGLEGRGWTLDVETVKLLDGWQSFQCNAFLRAVLRWREVNRVSPEEDRQ